MRKSVKHIEKKLASLVKKARLSEILPFTERPSEPAGTPGKGKTAELAASDLFSLFTADIIKEEVVFTR